MKEFIEFSPNVAKNFFELTNTLTKEMPFSKKQKELILIGIFTADNSIEGLKHHIENAIDLGATKDEILYAILLALPVIGITNTNRSFKEAYYILKEL